MSPALKVALKTGPTEARSPPRGFHGAAMTETAMARVEAATAKRIMMYVLVEVEKGGYVIGMGEVRGQEVGGRVSKGARARRREKKRNKKKREQKRKTEKSWKRVCIMLVSRCSLQALSFHGARPRTHTPWSTNVAWSQKKQK